jgi:hypothetical protein
LKIVDCAEEKKSNEVQSAAPPYDRQRCCPRSFIRKIIIDVAREGIVTETCLEYTSIEGALEAIKDLTSLDTKQFLFSRTKQQYR